MKAFWWKAVNNFGDQLTPLLLDRFSGFIPEWSPVNEAEILVVGSILDQVSPQFTGTILGSGKLHDRPLTFRNANVLAVRGPLTANDFPGVAVGDPGLLACDLILPQEKLHNLGIVPHWTDRKLEHRPEFLKYNPLIIRPEQPVMEVLHQIASCRKIVSSSLHGLIVADSFGIPRRFEIADQLIIRQHIEGGMFKFKDYAASLRMEFTVGKTQEAPRYHLEELQYELYDLFSSLAKKG